MKIPQDTYDRMLAAWKTLYPKEYPEVGSVLDAAALALEQQAQRQDAKRCCVCGTTEGLHPDGVHGFRCDRRSCIPF
jgi:hypothetical protein